MSTTSKKPAARPCVAALAPPAARARDLDPAELDLLAAYARMTPWARGLLVDIAADYAVTFSIKRARARELRLVPRGAK